MRFLPGLELCRRFHADVVAPILAERLPGLPYAAARIDTGSELLGLDTPRSMDHDWGPRLQLFLRPADGQAHTVLDEWLVQRLGFDPRETRAHSTG